MRNVVTIIASMLLIVLGLTPQSSASPINDPSNSAYSAPQVLATVTDLSTGEIVELETRQEVVLNEDGSFVLSAVTENAEQPENGLRSVASATRGTDVHAYLSIDYDMRGKNNSEIRLNRVWGKWVSQVGNVAIWGREVHYSDDGTPWGGNKGNKYPKGNSFNYVTGWGWMTRYPHTQYSGARAFSSATYQKSGMGDPFKVEVTVLA